MSDRVSVLQIKLSNTEKCAYTIKETSSKIKKSVDLKIQQNEESSKCLSFLKITIKHKFTSQLVRDDVSVLENFYNDVSTVLNELKNKSLVFLTGDWIAKVGKKSNSMPVTIVLEVLQVVFKITVDNISSISVQSTTFSSATQPFNTKLTT